MAEAPEKMTKTLTKITVKIIFLPSWSLHSKVNLSRRKKIKGSIVKHHHIIRPGIFSGWHLNRAAPAVLLFFVILILSSCSTKKNSFTRRLYHNLTAHYNAYWNGNESFKEGVRTLEEEVKDNYTQVLPVFKYGSEQDAQSIYPNMDRAIEKASKVIQRHSMYFKRKEWVRWIDDSYLLIGKAYLYKKEYSSARRTFEFVTNRFDEEDSRYWAELWMARTFNQSEEFEKAESVLDNLNSSLRSGKTPSGLEKEFMQVYANFHILQQEYPEAIKYLQRAIELNNRKKVYNRLRFILAQIYQELGETQAAARLYQQVIRKNPPYEMAFNAKINLAKTYDAKSSNRSMIVKKLNKMLKDDKNEEYLDQVYFALADIYLKDNQLEKGIEYLRLSVAKSVANDFQKSLSSLKLAEIYFEQPDYTLSQAYYDTAMQFLPREFPNYEELTKKTGVLTDLITNLQVIQVQDSLQAMAEMPEEERNAIIDEIIKKVAEEEARKAEEERERQRTLSMLEQTNRQQNRNIQQSGGWYFYNPSAVSFGFTEFQKKWGRRKLEDLWRLSNKQIIPEYGQEEQLAANDSIPSDSTEVVVTDPKKREFYLQDLPLTEEKKAVSDSLIEYALYNIGYIYKDGLKDNLKSIEAFEELLEKFPEHKNRLQVYYQLYKNYEEVPDMEQAEYYQNLIVKNYPESDYAKIIIDPNYNLVLEAQRNAAKNLYMDTYRAFMDKQFYMVINNYNTAAEKYQESDLLSKFEFLKALSLGQVQNMDTLSASLEHLIETYPGSEIKPMAEEILSRLTRNDDGELVLAEEPVPEEFRENRKKKEEKSFSSVYNTDMEAVHFFLLLVDGNRVNINALKIRISDFNSKYFRTAGLKINSIIYQGDIQMITIGNFPNSVKALNYYNSISKNAYVTTPLENTEYKQMVITVDNYPIFYREKDADTYEKYFEKVYLGEDPDPEDGKE